MRGGIVLPESTIVSGLPAFDGFGLGLVTGVRGQVIFQGPAADTGAVGLEVEATEQFAGGGAIGRGRFGGKQLGQERRHLRRPVWIMVAAGQTGRPRFRLPPSAGTQILAVEFVEAGPAESQFVRGAPGAELLLTVASQKVTNEGGRETLDQLVFSSAQDDRRPWIYRFETDTGRG